MLGLVMTGGGARGAYQAGVLKRIGEMRTTRANPFPIIGGSSAGAVNGGGLAAGCDDFAAVTAHVARLWSDLQPSDVYRCGVLSQAANSLTWLVDLSLGGVLGGGNARCLLDASPLRFYLSERLDCRRIQANIDNGHLYALAISATNYNSGKSYLFIQGRPGHPMWDRSRRVTLSTPITIDHICASAAIPLVFEPVKLTTALGPGYFGDGCIRLQQPLSPAIRLGAEKLVAISVRSENTQERFSRPTDEPSLAEVIGVLFDVMFLDHLSADIEHLDRLNRLLSRGDIEQTDSPNSERLRPLEYLLIAPSVHLSEVAGRHRGRMPAQIRYLIDGLGRGGKSVADILSYLLFSREYMRELIDIGYNDANARADEIEAFLNGSPHR